MDNILSSKSDTTHTHNYLPLTGGVLSGNLQVNGTINTSILYQHDENGRATIALGSNSGSVDIIGEAVVTVGNNINSGTDGNSRGRLRLYGTNSYYTDILSNNSANHSIYFPAASGTVSLEGHNHDSSYLKLSGGTLTGTLYTNNITPTGVAAQNIGYSSRPYASVNAKNFIVYDTGGVESGRLFNNVVGTTSTRGESVLLLGNNKATGTDNNARGYIRLYGDSTGYTNIVAGNNTTTSHTIYLPNADGTLALANHGHNILSSKQRLDLPINATVGFTDPGLIMHECYRDQANSPTRYGNLLTLKGAMSAGLTQICFGWSGSEATSSAGAYAGIYYRNKRDVATSYWSNWSEVLTTGMSNGCKINSSAPSNTSFLWAY